MDQDQRINQANDYTFSKDLGDQIEVIQSNTSTVEAVNEEEVKIVQTNTSIIRKKNHTSDGTEASIGSEQPEVTAEAGDQSGASPSQLEEPEVTAEVGGHVAAASPASSEQPEVTAEAGDQSGASPSQLGEPEVTAEVGGQTLENSGKSSKKLIHMQLNTYPSPSVPASVFGVLETVVGKVKAQIANQFFKTKLLKLLARAKQFLEAGKVAEAIAVLTVITDELEYIYDSAAFEKPPVNQIRRTLVEAEKTLIGFL